MTEYTFKLIQADNGVILKSTDGFPEDDPYIKIKEGDPTTSGDESPFISLIGKFFSDFIIEEEWGDGDNLREFEVTVKMNRIQ